MVVVMVVAVWGRWLWGCRGGGDGGGSDGGGGGLSWGRFGSGNSWCVLY